MKVTPRSHLNWSFRIHRPPIKDGVKLLTRTIVLSSCFCRVYSEREGERKRKRKRERERERKDNDLDGRRRIIASTVNEKSLRQTVSWRFRRWNSFFREEKNKNHRDHGRIESNDSNELLPMLFRPHYYYSIAHWPNSCVAVDAIASVLLVVIACSGWNSNGIFM